MAELYCEALVIHCIDYRLQKYLNDWLDKNSGSGNYDRVAIAGGAQDIYSALKHTELAVRLHKIRKVILINHEDCGAYGAEGTLMRHKADLDETHGKILDKFPNLAVERYYLRLDGTFEQLD
jgi:carbonic anhydrase